MPDFLTNMAQMATQGIYGLGSMLFNNELAKEREDYAREQNYQYNERAARAADLRTRNLYNEFYSPSAQLQQIKNAGLSPSLLGQQGMGVSGQTGAMGQGAAGISPTTYGLDPLTLADVKLKNAQAANLNADTQNKEGTGAMGAAQIAEMLANAGLKKAAEEYTKSLKTNTDYQNYILDQTKEFRISEAYAKAEIASHQIKTALYESLKTQQECQLFADTYEEQIRSIELENQLKLAHKTLIKSQTELSKEQIKEIEGKLQMWQEQVAQGWADVYIKALNAQTEKERNKIIDDYFDAQIDQLEKRLEFDKNKFDRQMRYMWTSYGLTFMNENNHQFMNALMQFVSMGAKTGHFKVTSFE